MAFRFKLKERLDDGFRRIAAEQIDRAREQAATTTEPEAGVHNARKALKRLRALLKLARPGIGQSVYRRENARIRDIARMFSGRRDVAVIRQTLITLEGLNGAANGRGAIAKVRTAIAAASDDAELAMPDGTLQALEEAKDSWAQLTFEPATFEPLSKGLRRSYRDFRRAFAEAYADGGHEAFHELRKTGQVHWRQMALLVAAWPELMSARVETARELSHLLGQDHDLFVLSDFLGRETSVKIDKKSVRSIVSICRKRQTMLRQKAHVLGVRLTAEGASGLSRRVVLYWSTAAGEKKLDAALVKQRTSVRPS